MSICTKCHELKDEGDFYILRVRGEPERPERRCKSCAIAAATERDRRVLDAGGAGAEARRQQRREASLRYYYRHREDH